MMEREIKFRACDKFQKKYVFTGFHICGEVSAFGGMESVIYETWKERSEALGYSSTIEAWDDFEFEQFTGMVDVNKKDIYESDILKSIKDDVLFNWLVVFEHGCFGIKNIGVDGFLGDFFHINSVYFFDDREIIGNVNENPELLKNE